MVPFLVGHITHVVTHPWCRFSVRDLATRFADGRLSNQKLFEANDEELFELLTAVYGIGKVSQTGVSPIIIPEHLTFVFVSSGPVSRRSFFYQSGAESSKSRCLPFSLCGAPTFCLPVRIVKSSKQRSSVWFRRRSWRTTRPPSLDGLTPPARLWDWGVTKEASRSI